MSNICIYNILYIYIISLRILHLLLHSLLASCVAVEKSEAILILDYLYMCQFFPLWGYIELCTCSLQFQKFYHDIHWWRYIFLHCTGI